MILVILPVIVFAISFVLYLAGVIYPPSCSGREEEECEGGAGNDGPSCTE